MVNCAFGAELWVEFFVFSAVFESQSENCRELVSEVARASERAKLQISSGPQVPGDVRFARSRRMLLQGAQVAAHSKGESLGLIRGVVATYGPFGIGSGRRTAVSSTKRTE